MNHAELLRLDAARRMSPAELREREPELADALDGIAKRRVKDELETRFADAPAELRDVVRGVDLSSMRNVDDVEKEVLEALEARGVSEAHLEDARGRLATAPVAAPVVEDVPLLETPELSADLGMARLHRLVSISPVDDGKAQAISKHGITDAVLDDALLEALVKAGDLTDSDAEALGTTVGVYRLVGEDPALTDAVLKTGKVTEPRGLVALGLDDWKKLIKADGVEKPPGITPTQHALLLSKRVAMAFPTETIVARTAQPDGAAITAALRNADSVLGEADALGAHADVPGDSAKVRDAVTELRALAASHPRLGLEEILTDDALSAAERAKKVDDRVGLLPKLVAANLELELMALDLSVDSEDIEALSFKGIPDGERKHVLGEAKALQRLLTVVRDPEDVRPVAAAGYHSATTIVAAGKDRFVKATGLADGIAEEYFGEALAAVSATGTAFLSIVDLIKGGFIDLSVCNVIPVHEHFATIDGWADLFGNQDLCSCEHCSSVLGPAAYFVDLLCFVEEHLTSRVFTGANADNELALKVRRPDLWTLPLTCENTNTEIPLLTIVAEILENDIATHAGMPLAQLTDRAAVWRTVYGDRLAGAVHSFKQPFMLPLERLEAFLAHFDRTRAEIAAAVGSDADVVAAAALSLSDAERGLVLGANTARAFLRRVYGIDFSIAGGAVAAVETHELMRAMDVKHEQLEGLLGSRFVQADGAEAITIRSDRRTPDSVQNDIELVEGLRASSLDRLHRFERLWRVSGWTPQELDLVLAHLNAAGLATGIDAAALRSLTRVRDLAKRFKLDADESTVLFDTLPTTSVREDRPALFERLFNLADFVAIDGVFPKPGTRFIHPALRDDPAAQAPDHALQRLLAGLRVDADELYALLVGLAPALGADPAAAAEVDRGFLLTLPNLSLLARHARLAKWLKLPIAGLFRTIAMAPGIAGDHVANLDELAALLVFADWLRSSKRTLDDLAFATGEPVADPTGFRAAAEVAASVIARVSADTPHSFTDTIFTFVEGVSEADSRAIVAANAGATVATPDGSLRLADDFDPGAALTTPAGVTAAEADLRALLTARHPSQLIPTYVASELKVDVPKADALIGLAGADLGDSDLAKELRGEQPPAELTALIEPVLRLAVLLEADAHDAASVDFVAANLATFDTADIAAVAVTSVIKLDVLGMLHSSQGTRGADLRAVLGAFTAAQRFANADQQALARVLETDAAVAASLQAHTTLPDTAPEALLALRRAAALATYIGVDGAALDDIAATDYDKLDAAANAVLAAFRAKYPDEKVWKKQIEPFEGRILGRRRDGLTEYLVRSTQGRFRSRADLHRYFLVDVEVDGCFTTSRVVAATGSLQLYVHRVLMNLERNEAGDIHVAPSQVPRAEWDWRQHYRVWEANRKVFLWSENYILPDLRDDKTPLFTELEAELLQTELDEQSVLDAYTKYVEGFQEVAGLRIAGSFHDIDAAGKRDVLHLFGVTPGDPPVYYYRRIENARHGEIMDSRGIVYGAWEPVDLKIPARRVAPVVHNGRLHVFWVEIVTVSQNVVDEGKSNFVGYSHKMSLQYATLRLDGRWSAPQKISLYGPAPFEESNGVIDDPLAEPAEWEQFIGALWSGFGIFGNPGATVSMPDAIKHLLTPRYDTRPHTKIREGYTLTGLEWQQIYPEPGSGSLLVWGAGYQMRASVDLFRRTTSDATSWVYKRVRNTYNPAPPRPTLGVKGGVLMAGQATHAYWDDYAYAALIADHERFERVLKERTQADRDSLSAGVWTTPIANVWRGDYQPINGSLSDGVLDVNGDIYLLQSSVRDGARWLLKRLGTTLADTVARALFAGGVDGLLDYNTQKNIGEAPRSFSLIGHAIDDKVVTGRPDYTGSYGVYYRELFFHIPFLIAQSLNAQGKYTEAQRWYQFIFDPTSNEIIADDPGLSAAGNAARKRDRNWRYREFRGLGLPALRAVLTDPKAIEVYKSDPFNPHAIARLRLGAYQKAIVMRYIDNLLDWADELFTQFQMESVNEAMILYATAADILGERPTVLGACGEGPITPRTYESIKPFLGAGTDFFAELEHWVATWRAGGFRGKKRKSRVLTIDASKAAAADDLVFTLPQIKHAAIASTHWAAKVSPAISATYTDVLDAAPIIEGRIASADTMVFGGTSDGIAERAMAAVPRREISILEKIVNDGRIAPAVDIKDVGGKVGLFADALTSTTAWAKGSSLAGESRYLPAATHKIKDLVVKVPGVHPHFSWSFMRQVGPAFCVPQNKDLIGYWDRLEDRLYKIRNCMDITGVRRKLSLFAPEIDPMALVRAKAAGLSLDEVLDAINGDLPPYRFTYLLEKAKAFAGTTQAFGNALLGALERRDIEELNELRIVHQSEMLALTTDVRTWELATAANAVESLHKRREAIEHRRAHFQSLVQNGLNPEEWTQRIATHLATAIHTAEAVMDFVSGVLALIPDVGSPFSMKYGGSQTGTAMQRVALGMAATADVAEVVASSAAMEASFSRRAQGWERDLEAAEDDLTEIDKQIEGAELRRRIAERAVEHHAKAIEQNEEIYDLFRSHFTNVGLYTWLSTETQHLYREAYNATYSLARLAERAYRFERDDDMSVSLQGSYWDPGKAGLRAGERLLIDLQRLERRYVETNYRTHEIDQAFSLLQLAPAALINLRETGRCEVEIPEIAFDMVYPGHYRRRIRSVRLTIPSVTGPYTNISATLRLKSSKLRRQPALGSDGLVDVPLPRTSTIATSTAQNDGGVFEMSFRDERYMPFEGAGAVSNWEIELPASFRQFNYQTINDVLVSIAYSAEEDGALRRDVQELNAAIEGKLRNILEDQPLGRLFSLRQDFSTAYHRLLHNPPDTPVSIEITDKHFPAFLSGQDLDVSSATLIVRTIDSASVGALAIKIGGTSITRLTGDANFGDLPAKSATTALAGGVVGEQIFSIANPGDLAPDAPVAGDRSALDEGKVGDIMLYVETKVA